MGRLLFFIVIGGLLYGGLHAYYGMSVTREIQRQVDDLGLSGLTVERVDFGPLAPLRGEAQVVADVIFGGAEATLDIRLIGHPLFSEEIRLELDGLQALRLRLRLGG